MSPSTSMRRSGTLYFRQAMRSTPMPNANPEYLLGVDAGHGQHVRIHHAAAEDLQPAGALAEPAALAVADARTLTSTSADGSVNGK